MKNNMQNTSSQPNIIMILIDDMGWMDLSCMGSTFYETPNIDRLAREGLLMTDAYAACPVCSPTRASLLTGKYPARVGITDWINHDDPCSKPGKLMGVPYIDHLPTNEYTLAQALQDNGYATWHVGKWHLGDGEHITQHHGFDVNIGGAYWGCPYKGYFAPWHIPGLDDSAVPDGTYLDTYLTDCTLDLLDQRDPGKPFYLNLWYYLVHMPAQAPEALIKKYEAKAAAMHLDDIPAIVEGDHFPVEHKKHLSIQRRVLQSDPVYAAMVETLDQNIGRLLDKLDALQLAEDTLIVFTSDNGGLSTAEGSPTCNYPLSEGKGWLEEGGVREPMLIRWPGVTQPGTITHQYVTTPDLYPTFLEAAGLDLNPTQHVDGRSMMPLMRGDRFERGPIYWHYPHYSNQGGTPGCSIRDGQWKLVELFEPEQTLQLFDLSTDVSELHNVADQHPDILHQMHEKLRTWRDQDIHGTIPAINPDYNPYE